MYIFYEAECRVTWECVIIRPILVKGKVSKLKVKMKMAKHNIYFTNYRNCIPSNYSRLSQSEELKYFIYLRNTSNVCLCWHNRASELSNGETEADDEVVRG